MIKKIKYLLENERFIEVIYFGTLQLKKDCDPLLHMYLGLACCAVIKPVAQYQKILNDIDCNEDVGTGKPDFKVTGNTLIVYEGFFHFIEAKRKNKSIIFEKSLTSTVKKVMLDLSHYIKQDFKGFIFNKKYSVRTVGYATYMLLKEFINDDSEMDFEIKRMEKYATSLIDKVIKECDGDADFYDYLPVQKVINTKPDDPQAHT